MAEARGKALQLSTLSVSISNFQELRMIDTRATAREQRIPALH